MKFHHRGKKSLPVYSQVLRGGKSPTIDIEVYGIFSESY
ncbi:MAG: hypothetical protein K940chlam9_01341 [Chlamydiae bacterium]|nr:hypothetical protein [Chlamydiota bacterium]